MKGIIIVTESTDHLRLGGIEICLKFNSGQERSLAANNISAAPFHSGPLLLSFSNFSGYAGYCIS
jgi:hypothetical protein